MRLSISKKMWLAFSTIVALLIIVCGITLFSLVNISAKYNEIIDVDLKKVELAKSVQVIQKDLGTIVLEYIMFAKDTALEKFDTLESSRKDETNELINITDDEKSLALLKQLQEKNEILYASNTEILALKKKGEPFSHLSSASAAINAEILAILDELVEIQLTNSELTNQEVNEFKQTITTTVISLAVISIILGLLIAYTISKSIANPVRKVTEGLEQVANGYLNIEPLAIKNNDEIGMMAQTFNKMLVDLQTIVSNVRDSSIQVATNAEELSASAEQSLQASKMVAQVSEQQMGKSNEQGHYVDLTVAAMDELNTSVVQIANNNVEMLKATTTVQQLVTSGSAVVENVADQMTMIHETFNNTTSIMHKMVLHSDEIEKVTTLITGISEQTNLLALNAAIEAARAGEYGKGFAVVAEEVRKLAEQSKQSASEIAATVQLIQVASQDAVQAIMNGGEKVQDGIQRTSESIDVFKEIKASVNSVVDKTEFVSSSIQQVQIMTEKVVENTNSIQTLAQDVVVNATDASAATEEQLASTEEITNNAQSLAKLAEKLKLNVNHFSM